jgi:hypothetical protein
MRKIFILSLSFLLLSAKGQITLEHTFDGIGEIIEESVIEEYGHVGYYILNNDICFYTQQWDYLSKKLTVKFYNSDYSLRNSCTFDFSSLQDGRHLLVDFVSQKLFNEDDLLEYVIYDNDFGFTAIYNENKELIKRFDGVRNFFYVWNYMHPIAQYQSKAKLIIHYADKVEIYSLPGTMPNNIENNFGKPTTFSPPYPNPSYSYINLPYKLEEGQTSVMRIFNMNGQLIEAKNIDATFNVIKLNVESYKSGVYIYEYNGVSNKFIVK